MALQVAEAEHRQSPVPILPSDPQSQQMDESDRRLLDEMRAGREDAFLALLDRHHGPMLRFAALLSADETAACTALVACWLTLADERGGPVMGATFRGWAYGVLLAGLQTDLLPGPGGERRPAVGQDRFLPPGDRWEAGWADPLPAWRSFEDPLLSAAVQQQVESALRRLSSTTRAVLVLRDVNRVAAQEVTDAMGISEDDQRLLLHDGRSRVREALAAVLQVTG
jgi:RNA polymerase sigma-70 factor, ECF subfamily